MNVVGLGEQHQACLWDSPLSVAALSVSALEDFTEDLQDRREERA